MSYSIPMMVLKLVPVKKALGTLFDLSLKEAWSTDSLLTVCYTIQFSEQIVLFFKSLQDVKDFIELKMKKKKRIKSMYRYSLWFILHPILHPIF